MTPLSRRHFLAGTTATFAGAAGALGLLGNTKAWAAETSGYKALVCIFLKGGMDHADTVLPLDQSSYDLLRAARAGLFGAYGVGSGTSSRDRANILELTPTNASAFGGRAFGLPAALAPLHQMFEGGDLAIVGNVGPLLEPTDRNQFERQLIPLPKRLFSHNDQQSTWMSLGVEGTRTGWGGRFADAAIAGNPSANPLYSAITTSSNDVFLSGNTARQFYAPSGASSSVMNIDGNRNILGNNSRFDPIRVAIRDGLLQTDYGAPSLYGRDFSAIQSRGVNNNIAFATARQGAVPFQTPFPSTNLGNQLKTVAETILVQSALRVTRQVFYVSIGGFDTHSDQARSLAGLHTQIANAMAAFRLAMIERNQWNNVVVFTGSDFGRTTIDNGDGTDHGWGAHHFVAGGQVAGRQIYGDIPPADLNSSRFTASRGRLIPSVSVEQYAATMGAWFGLSQAELASALPNLSKFPSPTLGFMQTGTG